MARWPFVLVLTLWIATPVRADLCAKCSQMGYISSVGSCQEQGCKGYTSSGAFVLCQECSRKLARCENCRGPLGTRKDPSPRPRPQATVASPEARTLIDESADGVYTSGPWRYEFRVEHKRTRSLGYRGKLFFCGRQVGEPATVNDYHVTPWGKLFWTGNPSLLFGPHEWMPRPVVRLPEGARLGEPPAHEPAPTPSVDPAAAKGTTSRK